MGSPVKRFLRVLLLEVADLESDLEHMVRICESRYLKREISERVCRENQAVLRNEIRSLHAFRAMVDGLDAEQFREVDDLCDHLRERVSRWLNDHGMCRCVELQLERKLRKVAGYVREGAGVKPDTSP